MFLDDERDKDGFIILTPNYSDLFRKVNYLAPIDYCVDRIIEYDIRHANTSVMRRYSSVLSPEVLDKLDSLGNQRNIEFGKLERDSSSGSKIKKALSKGIIQAKHELFRANLIQDADVLSVKNDAVFIIGRRLKHTTFGSVTFAQKNTYSAYLHIQKFEFYYNRRHDELAVKGLSNDILSEPDHQSGMVVFIKTVMRYLADNNRKSLRKYLLEFTQQYKALELPYQYYREFNADNCYRSKYDMGDFSFNYTQVNDSYRSELVTTFNYRYYVLPVIQMLYW